MKTQRRNREDAPQAAARILSFGLTFCLASSLAWAKDFDADGVDDQVDNCSQVHNPWQRDTDRDGFGNRCDADFDNDGAMTDVDVDIMRSALLTQDVSADLDDDHDVDAADALIFDQLYASNDGRPGPGREEPLSYPVVDMKGIRCAANTAQAGCVVTLVPGIQLETPRANLVLFEDQSGFKMVGDLSIVSGGLPIPMPEANLVIKKADGGGFDTVRGTARLPFPASGFLKELEIAREPMVTVGFDLGVNLEALDAPVLADRHYFFFHLDTAFEAGVGPISMATPGGDVTFVLDPQDPFFFVAGQISGLAPDGKKKTKNDAKKSDESDAQSKDESAEPGDDTRTESDSSDAEDSIEGQETKGEEDNSIGGAGFGFSKLGLIPFGPVHTENAENQMQPFSGHLLVRSSTPLDPLPLSIDGEVVYDLDPDEDGDHPFAPIAYVKSPDLRIGANGILSFSIPFLKVFSFGFEVGNASVQTRFSEDEAFGVFSGIMEPDLGFLDGLPIPVLPEQSIRMSGLLGVSMKTGLPHPDSFVEARGNLTIGAGALGDAIGLDLANLSTTEALIRMDRHGILITGSTQSQIHPSVGPAGSLALTVFVSSDGVQSYISLAGQMKIGGEGLEHAEIKVGPKGMFVNGTLWVGNTEFGMTGQISSAGYRLTGSAALADPIEMNVQNTVELLHLIASQDAAIKGIQTSMELSREGMAPLEDSFSAAQGGLRHAQNAVNSLNGKISFLSGRISRRHREIRSWKRKKCKWDQASCKAKRAYNISWRSADVGRLNVQKGTLIASKAVAATTLSAAQLASAQAEQALRTAQSVLATVERQLGAAKGRLAELKAKLARVPTIEGELLPVVGMVLENGRLSGTVTAEFNGMQVLDAAVSFDPSEACMTIPGQGELCSPI